jgi:hypothetical protein
MQPGQQDKQRAEQERQKRQRLTAVIAQHVLRALGEPGDLFQVQVRRVWEDHYRVNVLLGADAASTKVGHSYFLVADGDGNVVAAIPEITRQY